MTIRINNFAKTFPIRHYSRLPYQRLIGSITPNEYLTSEKLLKKISREMIVEKGIKAYSMKIETPTGKATRSSSANKLHWDNLKAAPINLAPDGTLTLLNSDKGVLLNQLFTLMRKDKIPVSEKTALINEGADNGDFLGYIVPALSKMGSSSISVSLVNGNVDKLALAHSFGSGLVGAPNVTSQALDSFKERPALLASLRKIQQFHLPFRLMIVESPDNIFSYLADRITSLKKDDLLLASFLHLDGFARSNFLKQGFAINEDTDRGYAVFAKPITSRARELIQTSPEEQSNSGLFKIRNTAFSTDAIQEMIAKVGGTIHHMSLIPTSTDEKTPIQTVGVIISRT